MTQRSRRNWGCFSGAASAWWNISARTRWASEYGLGSPLCLDSRHGGNDAAEGPIRDEWARMEVEAYVKVWQALHPADRVELIA